MITVLTENIHRLRSALRRTPGLAAVATILSTPAAVALAAAAVAGAIIAGRLLLASSLVGAALTPGAVALELAVALAVLAAVYLAAQAHPAPAIVLALLFPLYYVANLEMVAAMDTVVNIRDIVFAADAVFVRASAAHLNFLPYALVLLALSAGWALVASSLARRGAAGRAPARWRRSTERRGSTDRGSTVGPGSTGRSGAAGARARRRITINLTVAAVGLAAALAVALAPRATSWQEDSLVSRSIAESLQRGPGALARGGAAGLADAFDLDDFRGGDTATTPGTELERSLLYPQATDGERRNVLLVIVEGIPGVYLEQVSESSGVDYPVTMPAYSRIAAGGLTLSQSVAHARQTIRGLYSVLTGDTPRLDLSSPKIYSYTAADPDDRPPGLPHAMAELGYRTIYLQAAELSYMSKDLFMPEVGFEETHGAEFFDYQHVPFEWGPDDKAYLEQVAYYIDELQDAGGEPWFLTLLTVGTHHPYAVPDGYEDDFPNRKIAAVAYLDEALDRFWARLEESGVTDDTAVFIVSDESHGVTGHPLGRYWGTTVVRVPESDEHVLRDEPFGLIDIPRSILDYLGAGEHAARFAGRSVLRELDAPRTMNFGPYVALTEDDVDDDGNGGAVGTPLSEPAGARGAPAGGQRTRGAGDPPARGHDDGTPPGHPGPPAGGHDDYSVFHVRGERDIVRLTPASGRIFASDYDRADVPDSRSALIDRVTGAYSRATLIPGVEYAVAAGDRPGASEEPGRAPPDVRAPETEARQLILLRDSRGELSAGERATLTTAQYLEVPAGSRATLSLSLAAKAPGTGDPGADRGRSHDSGAPPPIRPRLQMLSGYESIELPLPRMPALEPGQTLELELTVPAAEALERIWIDLQIAALDGEGVASYVAHELRFEIEPTGDDMAGASAELRRFEVHEKADGDDAASSAPERERSETAAADRLPPVAHAGGAWRGHTYTNSVEALAANAGDFSIFEIDFEWTSDGMLVGLHDWDVVFERLYGFRPDGPLSYENFRSLDPRLEVTPVGLDDLRAFLDEHPDARIVTDVKRENLRALSHLAREIDDHAGRLIPQVYQPEEFAEAVDLGYSDIIWTLYRYAGNRNTDRIAGHVRDFRAIDENALFAVAMPEQLVHDGTAERLRQKGVPVYAHTINSCDAYLSLRELGVGSIYTDTLRIEKCD